MTARSTSGSISPCSAKNASARRFSSRRMKAEISGGVNSRSPRPTRTTRPVLPRPRNGNCPASPADVVSPLPMNRLTEYTVRLRRSAAAAAPRGRRTRCPSPATETIEGTSASPDRSRITTGTPSCT